MTPNTLSGCFFAKRSLLTFTRLLQEYAFVDDENDDAYEFTASQPTALESSQV